MSGSRDVAPRVSTEESGRVSAGRPAGLSGRGSGRVSESFSPFDFDVVTGPAEARGEGEGEAAAERAAAK